MCGGIVGIPGESFFSLARPVCRVMFESPKDETELSNESMAVHGPFEIAETVDSVNQTKQAFRLVIKREVRRQGVLFEKGGKYVYHEVATNWLEEEKDGWEGLEWYNKRGQAENFSKDIKNWVRDGADATIRVQNKER